MSPTCQPLFNGMLGLGIVLVLVNTLLWIQWSRENQNRTIPAGSSEISLQQRNIYILCFVGLSATLSWNVVACLCFCWRLRSALSMSADVGVAFLILYIVYLATISNYKIRNKSIPKSTQTLFGVMMAVYVVTALVSWFLTVFYGTYKYSSIRYLGNTLVGLFLAILFWKSLGGVLKIYSANSRMRQSARAHRRDVSIQVSKATKKSSKRCTTQKNSKRFDEMDRKEDDASEAHSADSKSIKNGTTVACSKYARNDDNIGQQSEGRPYDIQAHIVDSHLRHPSDFKMDQSERRISNGTTSSIASHLRHPSDFKMNESERRTSNATTGSIASHLRHPSDFKMNQSERRTSNATTGSIASHLRKNSDFKMNRSERGTSNVTTQSVFSHLRHPLDCKMNQSEIRVRNAPTGSVTSRLRHASDFKMDQSEIRVSNPQTQSVDSHLGCPSDIKMDQLEGRVSNAPAQSLGSIQPSNRSSELNVSGAGDSSGLEGVQRLDPYNKAGETIPQEESRNAERETRIQKSRNKIRYLNYG
ncbi:hypothetical protein AAMO2058_001563300 [Amorphochlora amoebiformis]